MKTFWKRQLAILLTFLTIFSLAPSSFSTVLAEDQVISSDGLLLPQDIPIPEPEAEKHEVVFMQKNAAGQYVPYTEDGFENPQIVEEGQVPQMPQGTPPNYQDQQFVSWGENAQEPVLGRTEIFATYRTRGTVTFAVEYMMEDQTTPAGAETSYVVVLEGNAAQGTINVPPLDGYYPAEAEHVDGFSLVEGEAGDVDNWLVQIDVANATESQTYRIVYKPNGDTVYYVDHYQQNLNGTYTLKETETRNGPTGGKATAEARYYEGFEIKTNVNTITDTILTGGQTRVRLEYDRVYYTVSYDLGRNGKFSSASQANPVAVRYGDTIPNVGTATRAGYTFSSWTYDGAAAKPASMPAKDVLAVAQWTANTNTKYTVMVFLENADNTDYTYYNSFTLTGTTGAEITSYNANSAPAAIRTALATHFTFDSTKFDSGKVIAGDGSTILNVYYARNVYTIRFCNNAQGTTEYYRITAKYEANISDLWSVNNGFPSAYANKTWSIVGETGYVIMTAFMPGANRIYYARNDTLNTTFTVHYMGQTVNETTGAVNTADSTYARIVDPWVFKYSSSITFNQDEFYAIPGYTRLKAVVGTKTTTFPVGGTTVSFSGSSSSINYFYYTLNTYTLDLYDRGSNISSKSVPYTAKLNRYNQTPTRNDGYTFGGWYMTQDFSGSAFNMATATMPAGNLALYARWIPPTYTVTFNSGAGTAVPQQVVAEGGYATEVADPTYFKHEFEGWYQDADFKTRFLFSQAIVKDLTLYAKYSGDDRVDVIVQYQDAQGSPLFPNDTVTGLLGETLTITARVLPNYMPTARTIERHLGDINGYTVTFVYNSTKQLNYTIHYRDAATGLVEMLPSKTITFPATGSNAEVTHQREQITGYTADAYEKTLILINPGLNEITFYYTKNVDSDTYTVTEYFESVDSDGYEARPTQTINSAVGTNVKVTPNAPTGYTYNAALSTVSGSVRANGALALEVYYSLDRHSYEVSHVSIQTGQVLAGGTRRLIKYGKSITEVSQEFPGFHYVDYQIGQAHGTGGTVTQRITDDTIKIQFNYNQYYTITAGAVNGTISPTGVQEVIYGEDLTFNYTPSQWHVIDELLVDGAPVANPHATTYTFDDVTRSHTIEIRFKKDQFNTTILAANQDYVYNASAQGVVGPIDTDTQPGYVSASYLLPGHKLASVDMGGAMQTDADEYTGTLMPANAKIVDATTGEDMNDYYVFSYQSGDLNIARKGNGKDDQGNQKAIVITAKEQNYDYTGEPQGAVGPDLDALTVAEVSGLLDVHTLKTVTINGSPQSDAGNYPGTLTPDAALIVSRSNPDEDVTKNYLIDGSTYQSGDLNISHYGGEKYPITIQAADQTYVYSAEPQGKVGDQTIAKDDPNPVATASGLIFGHRLAEVNINASQQTVPDTYGDYLIPRNAVILDANGQNVTINYLLPDSVYQAGTLTIHKKGNGSEGEDGSELPLDVYALAQSYVYNGQPQGNVGADLNATGVATASGLIDGHALQLVDIPVAKQTLPTEYTDYLMPNKVKIIDTNNNDADVTAYYLYGAEGFHPETLTITKKGSGDNNENPIYITAIDQNYIYNDDLQGEVGPFTGQANVAGVVTVSPLAPNHQLVEINIAAEQKKLPDTYTGLLVPTSAKIVDTANNNADVTAYYEIDDVASYTAGTLFIDHKGTGGGNSGNIQLTANHQTYVYNGQPQGDVGTDLPGDRVATAIGLIPTHRIDTVDIDVAPQTNAGPYPGYLAPSNMVIRNQANEDVTEYYKIDDATSYTAGSLQIDKRGSGTGNVDPLIITASEQRYVYNAQPQGNIGTALPIEGPPSPLATANNLADGHSLKSITISGVKQTNANEYYGALTPSSPVIVDDEGNEVTINYELSDLLSYQKGDLFIDRKGSGDNNENDVIVTAADQEYVYNAQPQGNVGTGKTIVDSDPLATAIGVLDGHRLAYVDLDVPEQTVPDTYTGHLVPSNAKIYEGAVEVTANYSFGTDSYVAGTLTIHKKGNGTEVDAGGEEPLDVYALPQSYVYNGQAQGNVGTDLSATGVATASGLIDGHVLQLVDIPVGKQTLPTEYTDYLMPNKVKIIDTKNNSEDVTDYYFYGAQGFHPATLTITKKGSGTDNENPLYITAIDQNYIYNDELQGEVGPFSGEANVARVVTVSPLAPGHELVEITIAAERKKLPDTYTGLLVPTGAKIVDTNDNNTDVTEYYQMDGTTYTAGTLFIDHKGTGGNNGGNIQVTANNQTYVYSGQPQGDVGTDLPGDRVATITGLIPTHRMETVDIDVAPQTEAGPYPGYLVPSNVVIRNLANEDVTDYYKIDDVTSYNAGTLQIDKKGSGTDNENPLIITASEQRFVYNAQPQGHIAPALAVEGEYGTLATAIGLADGHTLKTITISGTKQTNADEYPGTLMPSVAVIVDRDGRPVTQNYELSATDSYRAGDLFIDKKGSGDNNEDNVIVTAADQRYVYNAQPQGDVGLNKTIVDSDPLATAIGLLDGHRLAYVDLNVPGQTVPDTYTGHLVPSNAKIYAGTVEVTDNYSFGANSYVAGTLQIDRKGSGANNENPLYITARQQTYVYSGSPQGRIGANIALTENGITVADANGLVPGANHRIETITIDAKDGTLETNQGTYDGKFIPSNVRIVDNDGTPVTDYYEITEATYLAGPLVIKPLGAEGTGITITARDQHFVYDGTAQGSVGWQDIDDTDPAALAYAEDLIAGHHLSRVRIAATQQTEPYDYTDHLVISEVEIVDASGAPVTGNYVYGADTFKPGTLYIHKKGNGTGDGAGGEDPLDIYAIAQSYVYNGQPQGNVGTGLNAAGLATATGLLPGHELRLIDMDVPPQTNVLVYTDHLVPSVAVIVDTNNADAPVTDKYLIDDARSYHAATLTITQKGSGVDENGNQIPLRVVARDQHYTYNLSPQGEVGTTVTFTGTEVDPYATAIGLIDGHQMTSVFLQGDQQTEPNTYPDAILPQTVVITAGGEIVTGNYLINASSYETGDLYIHKKGNGVVDPVTGEEGPLDIYAQVQTFTYMGDPQGTFGPNLSASGLATADAANLLPGHELRLVSLSGQQQTIPDTYPNAIMPTGVQIVDTTNYNADVTAKYELGAAGYHPANLVIKRRGTGLVDPGTQEEYPLVVQALDQNYIYDDTLQGKVGPISGTAAVAQVAKLATPTALAPHQQFAGITIDATQQRYPGTYGGVLIPKAAKIIDTRTNTDVTAYYLIEDANHETGTLFIDWKGTGGDNSGNVTVTANNQSYVYSGQEQGDVGLNLPGTRVATITGLIPGHTFSTVSIDKPKQTDVVDLPGYLMPSNLVILNRAGENVTPYYKVDVEKSYVAGNFNIAKKGTGAQNNAGIRVQAANQSYVYNEAMQGRVGQQPVGRNAASPLATVTGLNAGHWLEWVYIDAPQQQEPNTYTNWLKPTGVKIMSTGGEVTSNYLFDAGTYLPGTLTIHRKGNGNNNGNGEDPLVIRAKTQTYVYNNAYQGLVQANMNNAGNALAEAVGLLPNHRIELVSIRGTQQRDAGTYTNALAPYAVVIYNGSNVPVTDRYLITAASYQPANLVITRRGVDGGSTNPIQIKAADQNFFYDGTLKGVVGVDLDVLSNPLSQATGLLAGHRVQTLTISGQQESMAGTYADRLVPTNAKIVDTTEGNRDVTANYLINAGSYRPGTLQVLRSNMPVEVIARDQVYIYNDEYQGLVGVQAIDQSADALASAGPLYYPDQLTQITLIGQQQRFPGTYLMTPAGPVVANDSVNVTGNYDFATFTTGNLVIKPKGSGVSDGDGGEMPLIIQALDQHYVYNEQPQGIMGEGLVNSEITPLVQVTGLLPGHRVVSVDMPGTPQAEPNTYTNALTPTAVVIENAQGEDVTAYYRIDATSFQPATLYIHKKGNGVTDPTTGGELPMEITTPDQSYVYDAQLHGFFGEDVAVDEENNHATALQLLPGHRVVQINLNGEQRVNAGLYSDAIMPSDIRIVNADGADVTDRYLIDETSYIPADLYISRRGVNGDPNSPLQVTVFDQTFTYNGVLQGTVGEVAIEDEAPLATLVDILPGHRFQTVTIADNRQKNAGTYTGVLMPTAVSIVDENGMDVTANYFFTEASYHGGTLTILRKGNGSPDPSGEGEQPLWIIAEDQEYYYNGRAQGITGRQLKNTGTPLVSTLGLIPGDKVVYVTISGKRRTEIGVYDYNFTPSDAVIYDAFGNDVTGNYLIESNSYWPGALIINEPLEGVLGVMEGLLNYEYTGTTSRDVGDTVE